MSRIESVRRPVLRYHGGKWRLADWIIGHMPAHRVYVEPFAGAASVLMQKPRSPVEVINDLNGRVVNVFRVLRDPGQAQRLQRLLELTPYSSAEFDQAFERSDDPVEDARRALVYSWQGHGAVGASGRHRTGWRRGVRQGSLNTAAEWLTFPEHVDAWTRRLQGVFIEQADALDVIARWDGPDTLFYVDPPYLPETRVGRPGVYRYDMAPEDHERLAECLNEVEGDVLLSGYDSDLYRRLYPDWTRIARQATCDGGGRRNEVLWCSPGAVRQGSLFDVGDASP